MPTGTERANNPSREASALDAIEAVSAEGLDRNSGRRMLILIAVAGLVLIVAAAVTVWMNTLERLAPVAVAVVLPELESAVGDNAKRQWEGFDRAFKDHEDLLGLTLPEIRFPYPIDKTPEDTEKNISLVMQKIKARYEDGVRIFVVTMSGAVKRIKPKFVAWVEEEIANEDDRPVLVATVASAPGIADSSRGVFRYYIRSRDESNVFSTYIDQFKPNELSVIYVSDDYGEMAYKILAERHAVSNSKPVGSTDDVIEKVAELMDDSTNSEHAMVVVVGYGSMVAKTLRSLKSGKHKDFRGEVLVVSTLTERAWRPDDILSAGSEFARRVHTVGPGDKDSNPKYRGVVFQFAYLTLDRALQCQKNPRWRARRGLEEFTDCWHNADLPEKRGKKWAAVELTANGDSHVALRLLDRNRW